MAKDNLLNGSWKGGRNPRGLLVLWLRCVQSNERGAIAREKDNQGTGDRIRKRVKKRGDKVSDRINNDVDLSRRVLRKSKREGQSAERKTPQA